jgi:hypothetical protein
MDKADGACVEILVSFGNENYIRCNRADVVKFIDVRRQAFSKTQGMKRTGFKIDN